jgi:hypothetical protein
VPPNLRRQRAEISVNCTRTPLGHTLFYNIIAWLEHKVKMHKKSIEKPLCFCHCERNVVELLQKTGKSAGQACYLEMPGV